jgi:predicted O-methyltransferase YrrM
MYNKLTLARKFIHYYFTAANGKGHGIHSPFIYQFVRNVLNDREQYDAYPRIEEMRKRMLKDATVITVEDRGAGSAVSKDRQRKINEIARAALKPPKYAQLLFRMAKFYHPEHILELGTSLGITTSYFASAAPAAQITTVEGAPAIAEKAKQHFDSAGLQNIQLITGDFDEVLGPALKKLPAINFAFIDGNHRKAPTLRYFEQILARSTPEAIFVLDDIHWSAEMEEAWHVIKDHPAVTCTVDLFFIGLVFLRDEFKTPQHFTIRF